MANLFALDSILLVKELKGCMHDQCYGVLVIQRCCHGIVDSAGNCEVDVPEPEGLSVCFFRAGSHVLGSQ